MNAQDYQDHVEKKELPTPDRLQHALAGLVSEVGEIADIMKKRMLRGGPVPVARMVEEMGGTAYYLAAMANVLGVELPTVFDANIATLDRRLKFGKDKHRELAIIEGLLKRRGEGPHRVHPDTATESMRAVPAKKAHVCVSGECRDDAVVNAREEGRRQAEIEIAEALRSYCRGNDSAGIGHGFATRLELGDWRHNERKVPKR